MPDLGPPDSSEQEQCSDCGSFMEWIDESDEIKQLHDEALELGVDPVKNGVPPGPWGHWSCPRCGDA